MNVGQSEPTLDSLHHIVHTKWSRDDLSVGRQADEAKHSSPCKADALWTRQAFVPPLTGERVTSGVGIMSVNEDVYVGQNHAA